MILITNFVVSASLSTIWRALTFIYDNRHHRSAKSLAQHPSLGSDKWTSGGSIQLWHNNLLQFSVIHRYRPSAKRQSIFEQVAGLSGLNLPVASKRQTLTRPALGYHLTSCSTHTTSWLHYKIVTHCDNERSRSFDLGQPLKNYAMYYDPSDHWPSNQIHAPLWQTNSRWSDHWKARTQLAVQSAHCVAILNLLRISPSAIPLINQAVWFHRQPFANPLSY